MQKKKSAALKLGLSAVAALALTVGGVAPAFAANMQIGPDAVAGFEKGIENEPPYNYDQWHIGNTDDSKYTSEDSLTFNECSVTTLAPVEGSVTQVLKGFPIDARPTTDGSTAPLEALVNSTSITVLSGAVTLQIPMVYSGEGELPEGMSSWTTVRSVLLEAGTYNLASLTITDSKNWTSPDDTFASLFERLGSDMQEGDAFQILGVGFTGSTDAEVESLSFGGDTYAFGTGDCTPAVTPAATPPTKIETAA